MRRVSKPEPEYGDGATWYLVDRISADGTIEAGIDGVASTAEKGAIFEAMDRNYLRPGDMFRLIECDVRGKLHVARAARELRTIHIAYVKAFIDGPISYAHNS